MKKTKTKKVNAPIVNKSFNTAEFGDPNHPVTQEINCSRNLVTVEELEKIKYYILKNSPLRLGGQTKYPATCESACENCGENFNGVPIMLPLKINEHGIYEFDHIFCGFPCAARFVQDTRKYNQTIVMNNLNKFARDCFGLYKETSVGPAPEKKVLQKYGGHLSLEQYRLNGVVWKVVDPKFVLKSLIMEKKIEPGEQKSNIFSHLGPLIVTSDEENDEQEDENSKASIANQKNKKKRTKNGSKNETNAGLPNKKQKTVKKETLETSSSNQKEQDPVSPPKENANSFISEFLRSKKE